MASPPGTPGQTAQITLTPREIELLACGMQSTKDANPGWPIPRDAKLMVYVGQGSRHMLARQLLVKIQIDYDKFAALAGLTIGSARVLWGKLRRKLEGASGRGGTPASAKSQTSKSKLKNEPTKRKLSDIDDANADDDDTGESPESPTKAATKRRAKKAKRTKKAKDDIQVKDDVQVKEEGDNAHVKDEDATEEEI
ncbi:uncharacterized protein DNG_05929 [Cephalotrichum gorgonifer]|uniref:Uncharacterized protein n=1 Tax=Cephalotrichum gorgonifer TaxID=2041049 RepID=A0AAE8MZ53_9PEZI|nr:uncharacterized protein DNG_05929 [Cephalotrichum gorgonifer]